MIAELVISWIFGFCFGMLVFTMMVDEIIVKRFDRNIKRINSQIKDKSLLERTRR